MIDPFRRLDPPLGGLTRLRARLDASKPDQARWIPAFSLAAATAAALLLTWRAGLPPASHAAGLPDSDSPGLIALGLVAAPGDPVSVPGDYAVEPVSSSREVLFYRVASLSP